MQVEITNEAADYIKKKGGHLLIFLGSLSGCCTASGIPAPSYELGRPRRSPENYEMITYQDIMVHLDKEVSNYPGKVEVGVEKILWWNSLTFKYLE